MILCFSYALNIDRKTQRFKFVYIQKSISGQINLLNLKSLSVKVLNIQQKYIQVFSSIQEKKLNETVCARSIMIKGEISWKRINSHESYWTVSNICGSLLFAPNWNSLILSLVLVNNIQLLNEYMYLSNIQL